MSQMETPWKLRIFTGTPGTDTPGWVVLTCSCDPLNDEQCLVRYTIPGIVGLAVWKRCMANNLVPKKLV